MVAGVVGVYVSGVLCRWRFTSLPVSSTASWVNRRSLLFHARTIGRSITLIPRAWPPTPPTKHHHHLLPWRCRSSRCSPSGHPKRSGRIQHTDLMLAAPPFVLVVANGMDIHHSDVGPHLGGESARRQTFELFDARGADPAGPPPPASQDMTLSVQQSKASTAPPSTFPYQPPCTLACGCGSDH